jgi:hypothetical protein
MNIIYVALLRYVSWYNEIAYFVAIRLKFIEGMFGSQELK